MVVRVRVRVRVHVWAIGQSLHIHIVPIIVEELFALQGVISPSRRHFPVNESFPRKGVISLFTEKTAMSPLGLTRCRNPIDNYFYE